MEIRTKAEIAAEARRVDAELERLAEKPSLTAAEEARFDELEREADRLAQERKFRDLEEAGLLQTHDGVGIRNGNTSRPEGGRGDRGRALSMIEAEARRDGIGHDAAERATRLVERDRNGRAAAWVTASADPDYLEAFRALMIDPVKGHMRWSDRQAAAFRRVEEYRAASLTDADGGFLVPFALDPSIILTSNGSVSAVRRVARVVTGTSDTWNGVSSAGITASWDGEATEVSDDAPTLAQPSVAAEKLQAYVPFSIEVGQDGANFQAEMSRLLADAADQLEAAAFINGAGSGSNQPEGLSVALDGGAQEIAPTTAETFTGVDDSQKLLEALAPRFRNRASFIAELSTFHAIGNDLGGGASDRKPEILSYEGGMWRLLTKPAYEDSNVDPASGINAGATADNFIMYVGDFAEAYLVYDRVGTTVELVPHVFGANRRPTGERGLYMYKRVGGGVINDTAVAMLSIPTTA